MQRFAIVFLIAFATTFGACASRPFDVRVISRVEPDAISPPTQLGGLVIRADAMWDQDWLLDNFDANTVLAGVLPVRTELANTTGAPMKLKGIAVIVRDAGGRRYDLLDGSKARKTIENYYGLSFRSKNGEKLYKQDFAANVIDLRSPLGAGEHRQGFLFVRLPAGDPRQVALDLSVHAKGLGPDVIVALK